MGIGAEGAQALAQLMESRVPIISLDLWSNALGPKGTAALSKGLMATGSLQSLILKVEKQSTIRFLGNTIPSSCLRSNSSSSQGNFIGPSGMRELCPALEGNITVTTLDISGNRLGIEGSKALSALLKVNQNLKSVDAGGNNLDNEGVALLMESLKSNGDIFWHIAIASV